MLSKIMVSRNYKKRKHGVVIHLNNFASEEEKAKLEAVIRAAINSKKAALGEGCESESEPEAEDKEEEG